MIATLFLAVRDSQGRARLILQQSASKVRKDSNRLGACSRVTCLNSSALQRTFSATRLKFMVAGVAPDSTATMLVLVQPITRRDRDAGDTKRFSYNTAVRTHATDLASFPAAITARAPTPRPPRARPKPCACETEAAARRRRDARLDVVPRTDAQRRLDRDELSRTLPPPLVWEFPKGTSYSSPAIAGDRLMFIHRVGDEEIVECLDAGDGREPLAVHVRHRASRIATATTTARARAR